ncbi:bZIP transcription factor 23 [Zea mays]|uniref:ABSCISIC ACID-INSENSITIVE 5-like protein 5 n=2 Tax=Zea mays TaxID=4577 RepID=A0A1D6HL81_MAIZE|nr:bZIP transcription factor 23 [Zea mays]AQK75181.1 ABSCISIC ACID-INSENSITIVE 5-like protein 5 [Zea mays]PWZ22293.1 bZIP transcription factor 23 [Zea mays]
MDFPGGSGRRPQQQEPEHLPPMTPLPLARQGSVYSLTFDEFQSSLGGAAKDFGSMNMDELLRSIWSAEEVHSVAAASASAADHAHAAARGPVSIQHQGSLTLPRTLSQKTVDEVWRDLTCVGGGPSSGSAAPAAPPPPAQRHPTLGEITLEEFLVRAGVVREDMTAPPPVPPAPVCPAPAPRPPVLFPHGNVLAPLVPPLQFGNGFVSGAVGQQRGGPVPPAVSPRPVTASAFGKMEGDDLSSLSPSPVPYIFGGGLRGRKPPAMEKVVERRQRRMIKNRESAARSRQRKQAYMMELEAEVAKLKELNDELQKKQVEMLEKQKNEVLERMRRQVGPTAKRICLRRTLTGPW